MVKVLAKSWILAGSASVNIIQTGINSRQNCTWIIAAVATTIQLSGAQYSPNEF
jgi:hypothetical protein